HPCLYEVFRFIIWFKIFLRAREKKCLPLLRTSEQVALLVKLSAKHKGLLLRHYIIGLRSLMKAPHFVQIKPQSSTKKTIEVKYPNGICISIPVSELYLVQELIILKTVLRNLRKFRRSEEHTSELQS